MTYALLALENPLLDIQAVVKQELMDKYGFVNNGAMLASEKEQGLYEEIVRDYPVVYVAGGAAQNTARGAQYLLPPNSTVYMGCVSNDHYADQMKKAAAADGLETKYQIVDDVPTGTCAVLITGQDRFLCANLSASEKFSVETLQKPENWQVVESAKNYYIGAFFISHDGGYASSLAVGKHAAENNKAFTMNLSAPWVALAFRERLDAVLNYADIVFGNEDEARSYSKVAGWETDDLKEIAVKFTQLPKANTQRPRIVVFTQGSEETIVAVGDKVSVHPVDKVESSEIVDTNGAGDGFCGGFLGLYTQGVEDIHKCVNAGHYIAGLVIRRTGPTYPPMAERTNIPEF
ncbi:Ribokinase-like protein [Umbelopsis sp. PMI_123]|nr:Ribokinase-like protein [Umbelopsis sp. PMI_123]